MPLEQFQFGDFRDVAWKPQWAGPYPNRNAV